MVDVQPYISSTLWRTKSTCKHLDSIGDRRVLPRPARPEFGSSLKPCPGPGPGAIRGQQPMGPAAPGMQTAAFGQHGHRQHTQSLSRCLPSPMIKSLIACCSSRPAGWHATLAPKSGASKPIRPHLQLILLVAGVSQLIGVPAARAPGSSAACKQSRFAGARICSLARAKVVLQRKFVRESEPVPGRRLIDTFGTAEMPYIGVWHAVAATDADRRPLVRPGASLHHAVQAAPMNRYKPSQGMGRSSSCLDLLYCSCAVAVIISASRCCSACAAAAWLSASAALRGPDACYVSFEDEASPAPPVAAADTMAHRRPSPVQPCRLAAAQQAPLVSEPAAMPGAPDTAAAPHRGLQGSGQVEAAGGHPLVQPARREPRAIVICRAQSGLKGGSGHFGPAAVSAAAPKHVCPTCGKKRSLRSFVHKQLPDPAVWAALCLRLSLQELTQGGASKMYVVSEYYFGPFRSP